MLPSYFDYIFMHLKKKSTSDARIKSEIFVDFRPEPEPDPKIPARLTTLDHSPKKNEKTVDQEMLKSKLSKRPLEKYAN